MDWRRDLPSWSHPALSQRVRCDPHYWHVQEAGEGPELLLLPGVGSSVHTWRNLIYPLAASFKVIAVDLPGQGFTMSPPGRRVGLLEMVEDLSKLIETGGWKPICVIGHSAGAAIALKLAKLRQIPAVLGINPALDRFDGIAGHLFPLLARGMAVTPFISDLFAFSATANQARRLIERTGSSLDEEGLSFYARLMADKAHVNGTIRMMAHWVLDELIADLPNFHIRTLFLTGSADRAVPPRVADQAAARMPDARVERMEGFGHLLHEESPPSVFASIGRFLA